MRRPLVIPLLIAALLGGGAAVAGLDTSAALAAGSTATTAAGSTATSSATSTSASSGSDALPNPSLNLSNAEQNAAAADTSTATPVTTTTTSSSGGLSGADAILIAVVAIVLLCGIAFWVWRDSRHHAARVGHGHEDPMYGGRSHPGSKTPHRPRKLTPAERKRRKRGRAR